MHRYNKKLRNILIVSIIFVLIALFAWFFLSPVIQDSIVKASLKLAPNWQLIFEDTGQYTSSVAQKSMYYWFPASLNDVTEFLEGFFPSVWSSEDIYGNWFIFAYSVNGGLLNAETDAQYILTHEALCASSGTYQCVSVAVVDYTQLDAYRLAVVSPIGFRRDSLPSALSSVPHSGTLIIYSYYIRKFV